ncbi:EamA family transporter RarD [Teredinibacter turnerae]|uniref:EamA family transporter RarD n=1 Tax=Teredinibacter turnerae TaxID=2426 RepID=UPI0005F77C18|nr:EamA family transporter RarD [Teredinibacter turnerae]
MQSETAKGLLFAVGAYGCWGFVPLYFKAMDAIPEGEIFVHRILWSVLFTGLVLIPLRRWKNIWPHLCNLRTLLVLSAAAVFIAVNWIVFIWASNNDRLLDTSIGYYINPLINVLFGLLFLGEKLRRMQWVSVSLAAAAVLLQIITLGKLPVISLTLAFAFGFYGLMRKIVQVGALEGLFIETLLLLPPTLIYFCWFSDKLSFIEATGRPGFAVALMAAGPITSIPLLLFASGVSRLKYSTIGFIQYLAPSIVFLLAIFWFREPLVWQMAVTFALIWVALAIYSFDGLRRSRTLPLPPE